jgi:hypothetical protein
MITALILKAAQRVGSFVNSFVADSRSCGRTVKREMTQILVIRVEKFSTSNTLRHNHTFTTLGNLIGAVYRTYPSGAS